MPDDGARSQQQDDLATLSAVADFVINLSIAERSHLIYGASHPMARKTTAKVLGALRRSLELQNPIALHFTREAVFCGTLCLERSHPIYRRLAEKMWHFGIAGLTFFRGVDEDQLTQLISVLNTVEHEHAGPAELERQLSGLTLKHIEYELLREMVSYSDAEEVEAISREEQNQQWNEFMRHLAALRRPSKTGPEDAEDAAEPEEAIVIENEQVEDYATAVIDYMKQLQRSRQQDALLAETELGQKIVDFLDGVNPELRHQIMSTAITESDISSDTLEDLVNLVGFDHLVEALQRLSDTGGSLPPSVFRTLSVMAHLEPPPEGAGRAGGEAGDPARPKAFGAGSSAVGQDLQGLIEGLFADDRLESYMSPEYQRTMDALQASAEQLAKLDERHTTLAMSQHDVETHFVAIVGELLASDGDDEELVAAMRRESEKSLVFFLEEGMTRQFAETMDLVKRTVPDLGPDTERDPFVWETPEVLDRVISRLTSADRWIAEEGQELTQLIGEPAVPTLLETLETSDSITARKRILEALEALEDRPVGQLLGLLEAASPWYVKRNAVYLLRRVGNPSGLEAAKACWDEASTQLKVEILRYLIEREDPASVAHLRDALDDDQETALACARAALKNGERRYLDVVIEREQRVPPHQLGSRFHVELLSALARSGMDEGRAYVESAIDNRKPLVPWRRDRFNELLSQLIASGGT